MIRQIINKELELYYGNLLKLDTSFVMAKNTIYYAYIIDNQPVSFIGILIYKRKVVIQMCYTKNEYRRKGIFYYLLEHILNWAKNNKIEICEATATDMSYPGFIKNGFTDVKQFKKYKKIKKEL